jgi:hypothetical protein
LVPEGVVEASNLPSSAELYVLRQPDQGGRHVIHVIHGVPQRRGEEIDIVEDLLPLHDVRIGVRTAEPVTDVELAPSRAVVGHETIDGVTWVTVPEVAGHQVIVFS